MDSAVQAANKSETIEKLVNQFNQEIEAVKNRETVLNPVSRKDRRASLKRRLGFTDDGLIHIELKNARQKEKDSKSEIKDKFNQLFFQLYGSDFDEELNQSLGSKLQTAAPKRRAAHGAEPGLRLNPMNVKKRVKTENLKIPDSTFSHKLGEAALERTGEFVAQFVRQSVNGFMVASVLLMYAKLLLASDVASECFECLALSLNVSMLFEEPYLLMLAYRTLGEYFCKMRKHEVALLMYTRGLQLALTLKDPSYQSSFFDLLGTRRSPGLEYFNVNDIGKSKQFHSIMLKILDLKSDSKRVEMQTRITLEQEKAELLSYLKVSGFRDVVRKYSVLHTLCTKQTPPWFYSTSSLKLQSAVGEVGIFHNLLLSEFKIETTDAQEAECLVARPLLVSASRGEKLRHFSKGIQARKATLTNKALNKPFIVSSFTEEGRRQLLENDSGFRKRFAVAALPHKTDQTYEGALLKTHESNNKNLAMLLIETNLTHPTFSKEKRNKERAYRLNKNEALYELLVIAIGFIRELHHGKLGLVSGL